MNKKGLSLLEILIAALILTLVITGLVSIFVSGKRLILHSRARISAGELGKFFLDPLKIQVRQDEWQWGANCLSNNAACNPQQETVGPITYNAVYNTSDVLLGPGGPRRVTVNITWNEPAP